MQQHVDANRLGLTPGNWFLVFVYEHERRTGLELADFDKEEVIETYYSDRTTPSQGVDQDIDKHGLDELS